MITTSLRTLARACALSAAMLVGSACSTSQGPRATTGLDQTVAQLGPWTGGLSDTTPLAPVALAQTEITASNGDNWVCQNTQYDDKKNLDQLLSPGANAGVLWPGALIQGASLMSGEPAGIPLPRSPIAISIDLAVDTPSVQIADPTSASVQTAVADLQRQADARLGPIDVVPARIDFRQIEAFSERQASLDVGIYAKFPVQGVTASVSVSGGVSGSFQQHTIAVTLVQTMYTISFADEEKVDPNNYLASSVTPAQVQDVVNRGLISGTNLPVYVKSVTYGRLLVFTMTNTTQASASDLQVAIKASVAKFGGGVNVSAQQMALLANSDLHVQAFGGSQDSALAAIRGGDLSKFFTAVAATQAVPLAYRINYLKDGTVALLGAETKYTQSNCSPTGTSARYWHLRFDSLTSTANCQGPYGDSAFVYAGDTTIPRNGIKYLLLGQVSSTKDTTVNKEIVIALAATGGVGLQAWSAFIGSTCPAGGCYAERIIGGSEVLPATPYRFTQFVSLPGQEAGCVATFYWEVSTDPVLDRRPAGTD